MKQILFILLFASFGAMAQNPEPMDTSYHSLSTYRLKYNPSDSILGVYLGNKYKFHYVVSREKLNYTVDSLMHVLVSKDQTIPDTLKNGSIVTEGIQFDTTPTTTNVSEGLLRWNPTDGTLDLGQGTGGIVTQQIGQELYIKVVNKTGATISEGKAVYFVGRQGTRPKIKLARADVDSTSHVAGIVTEDIANNAEGYITTYGYVRKIKTDYATWAEGQLLYLSKTVAGDLVNVEPSVPHHSDAIGTIGVVHGTQGSILVNLQKHKDLTTLSDVNGTPLSHSGQFPVWDHTNKFFDFTKNANGLSVYHGIETIGNLSFDNTSHVFTVAAGGLTYWNRGQKHTSTTAKTVDLDDVGLVTNKLYYIYFADTTGVLTASQTTWQWHNHTFVGTVFWNGSVGAIQDEDHNHTRNIDWQIWAHSTIGTRYRSGLSLTSPTTATDASLSVESGTIQDEDHTITISAQTTIRGWYPVSPTVYTFSNYSLPYLGTLGAPVFLDTDTYTLQTFPANRYAVYWVYASNDQDVPIYVIPSQLSQTYTTLALARAETAPDLINIPINSEMKIIYKFIYTGDGEFVESVDYRGSSPLPAGGSSSTTAGAVSFAPYGTILSTNVQKALEEFNDSTFKNLTQYYVPKYNNKNFIKSKIYDNGLVHLNGITPDSMMTITGGAHFTTGIKLDQPQGKAPLTVSSTTVNTNLNADLLDGRHVDYLARRGYVDTTFVVKNTPITGTTKTKITYDVKGLVTAGADATTADIASSTDKRYVTDAQLSNIHASGSDNQTLTIAGTTSPTIALSGSNTATFSAGTGITLGQTAGTITVTNSAPSSGGTVTNVSALTLGTSGTDLSSTVANSTTTPVITLNVPTASATNRGALSSTDWSTFNSKQPAGTYSTDIHGNITALNAVSGVNTGDQDLSGLAPISGSGYYIQNQNASAQSANMWIDGSTKSASFSDGYITWSGAQINRSGGYVELQWGGLGGVRMFGNTATAVYFTSNGAIETASTIQATTAKLINLSDGYLPYHISDASGLGNSPIYTNGTNVGIGTVSPSEKLHVVGNGIFDGKLSILGSSGLEFVSATNTGYQFFAGSKRYGQYVDSNTGDLITHVSGSNRLVLSQTGSITASSLSGTGTRLVTADASGTLGSSTATDFVGDNYIKNQTASAQSGNYWINGSARSGRLIIKDEPKTTISNLVSIGSSDVVSPMSLFIQRNANNYFAIWGDEEGVAYKDIVFQPNGGKIGIGTVSPSEKLHVVGNAKVDGNIYANGSIGSINNDGLNSQKAFKIEGFSDGAYASKISFMPWQFNGSTYDFREALILKANLTAMFPSLAGTGTRMVVADSGGTLSTQTIPSGGGGGTVVTVGVTSANGFAGTSSGGDNPALTLSTTVSGVLYGNGTAMSAASSANIINALGYTPYNSTNPSGYITGYTETDPTIYAWAKASTKPSYSYSEISSTPTIGNGTLTLAVSGSGISGSQTFTANQSSNATFTITSNATTANTASTIVLRDGSGNVSLSGDICTSSDSTLKRNVQSLTKKDFMRARQVDLVKFAYKADSTGRLHFGGLAQDIEKYVPEVVSTNAETGKKQVNYTELLLLMVAQQKETIERLEKRIEKLENNEK